MTQVTKNEQKDKFILFFDKTFFQFKGSIGQKKPKSQLQFLLMLRQCKYKYFHFHDV